jgi:hypothetical protein
MSTPNPTVLDLSGATEITAEQYRLAMESLLAKFEEWRHERGWCSEFYRYVGQLSHTFHWNPGYEVMTVDFPEGRRASTRLVDLQQTRGRVLRFAIDPAGDYASGESIGFTLDKANEFLRAAGLPEYVPQVPSGHDFSVYVGGFSMHTEDSRTDLEARVRAALQLLGAPASVYIEINERSQRRNPAVAESDTVELLPLPRSC